MACNTELEMPSPEVVDKSCAMYAPVASQTYGPLEWQGLTRRIVAVYTFWRD